MIENLSNRIKNAIERRSLKAGADGSEVHEVIIEQGQEVQRPRAGIGQIESSIPFSKWPQPAVSKEIRVADVLDANPKPLAPDAVVKIGDRVTITPSTITGFEASFTRNYSPFDVKVDGKIIRGEAAMKAIYEALLRESQTRRK